MDRYSVAPGAAPGPTAGQPWASESQFFSARQA